MCGTDGVTYPNKCVLQNISPNVRIDYKGYVDGITHETNYLTDPVDR